MNQYDVLYNKDFEHDYFQCFHSTGLNNMTEYVLYLHTFSYYIYIHVLCIKTNLLYHSIHHSPNRLTTQDAIGMHPDMVNRICYECV